MKTAVSVPDNIFLNADSLAKRLGMSRSKFYTNALKEYIKVHKTEHITEKLNQVYSKDDSSTDPVLSKLQFSIAEVKDEYKTW